MLSLFIFIIIIIFKADAQGPDSENPIIRLFPYQEINDNYTVFKDKPLKIVIENGFARFVWCAERLGYVLYSQRISFKNFVPETKYNNDMDINNVLYITHVTDAMSSRWGCIVLQEYHGTKIYTYRNRNYTAYHLHFNLHVKGARQVILIANNQILTYVTTNLSVNYDGEANYTYEDSEDFSMDFSCKKANDKNYQDTLRLEYYNAEGILLFQTKPRITPHIFRSVLKSNNDKYYLDCIRASSNPDREYRYRTTFYKRYLYTDAVQHAVIMSVNDQKLSTFLNIEKSYDDYIFKYIDGEVLNVTCRKMDVNKRGYLSFYSDAKITMPISVLRSPSGEVISINVSPSDFKNNSLICGINNMDVEKPNARLSFLSDVPGNDVRIRGLPRHNILYQYTNDEDQWTIEYQYSVNDTLNITCVWKEDFYRTILITPDLNPFLWELENQLMFDSAAIKMQTIPPSYYSKIPFTKVLDATHNGTKIKCIYFPSVLSPTNKSVEIILQLKQELISEAKMEEDTSEAKSDEDTSGMYSVTPTNSYTLVYCLTAAGVSVIILLAILYWTVKKPSCCIRSSSQELPPVPTPSQGPATAYYENLLPVFNQINDREAQELENHYEEIE